MGIGRRGRPGKGRPQAEDFGMGKMAHSPGEWWCRAAVSRTTPAARSPDWTRHMPPGRKRPGPVSPGTGGYWEKNRPFHRESSSEGGGAGAGRAGASTGRRARGAGGPAASRCQGKDQSWYQGYGGGKEQTAPAVPPKHAGIKDSGQQQDGEGLEDGAGQCCPQPGQGVCQGPHRGGGGEDCGPPLRP